MRHGGGQQLKLCRGALLCYTIGRGRAIRRKERECRTHGGGGGGAGGAPPPGGGAEYGGGRQRGPSGGRDDDDGDDFAADDAAPPLSARYEFVDEPITHCGLPRGFLSGSIELLWPSDPKARASARR